MKYKLILNEEQLKGEETMEEKKLLDKEDFEFIRNPGNPGLNKTGKVVIFQQVLMVVESENYLTVDIDSKGKVINEYYTYPEFADPYTGEEIIKWY